jgi:hypothetical protein
MILGLTLLATGLLSGVGATVFCKQRWLALIAMRLSQLGAMAVVTIYIVLFVRYYHADAHVRILNEMIGDYFRILGPFALLPLGLVAGHIATDALFRRDM